MKTETQKCERSAEGISRLEDWVNLNFSVGTFIGHRSKTKSRVCLRWWSRLPPGLELGHWRATRRRRVRNQRTVTKRGRSREGWAGGRARHVQTAVCKQVMMSNYCTALRTLLGARGALAGKKSEEERLYIWDLPSGSVVKNPPANAGDAGSILGSGRSPGGGDGNPLQHSCLGNPWTKEPYRL